MNGTRTQGCLRGRFLWLDADHKQNIDQTRPTRDDAKNQIFEINIGEILIESECRDVHGSIHFLWPGLENLDFRFLEKKVFSFLVFFRF